MDRTVLERLTGDAWLPDVGRESASEGSREFRTLFMGDDCEGELIIAGGGLAYVGYPAEARRPEGAYGRCSYGAPLLPSYPTASEAWPFSGVWFLDLTENDRGTAFRYGMSALSNIGLFLNETGGPLGASGAAGAIGGIIP